MAPGKLLQNLVDEALLRAELDYQKRARQAERAAERIALERDWSPASDAARMTDLRRASFEFLGTVLFAFVEGYSTLAKSEDDMRHQVGWMITKLREIILKDKWPTPRPIEFDWETKAPQQFDATLIPWLENRPAWKEYEARTIPQIQLMIRETNHPRLQ